MRPNILEHERKLIDAVKHLPGVTEQNALHSYVDAPFGAFAERARCHDPLWGLARDFPRAFAESWRAMKWLQTLTPSAAAAQLSVLPPRERELALKNLFTGIPGEDEDGEQDWCEMDMHEADEKWLGNVKKELNQLTTGSLL